MCVCVLAHTHVCRSLFLSISLSTKLSPPHYFLLLSLCDQYVQHTRHLIERKRERERERGRKERADSRSPSSSSSSPLTNRRPRREKRGENEGAIIKDKTSFCLFAPGLPFVYEGHHSRAIRRGGRVGKSVCTVHVFV